MLWRSLGGVSQGTLLVCNFGARAASAELASERRSAERIREPHHVGRLAAGSWYAAAATSIARKRLRSEEARHPQTDLSHTHPLVSCDGVAPHACHPGVRETPEQGEIRASPIPSWHHIRAIRAEDRSMVLCDTGSCMRLGRLRGLGSAGIQLTRREVGIGHATGLAKERIEDNA